MGKAFTKVAIGAVLIGASLIPGVNVAVGTALASIGVVGGVAAGIVIAPTLLLGLGAAEALAGVGGLIAKKPSAIPLGMLDRLQASLNPSAPRTIVFGETAGLNDVHFADHSVALS